MITEGKEIKFGHWLKNKLTKAPVDYQRIENTTGSGVPDVNACWSGREAWIELKVYHQGNVVLRKEQYAWLTRRHTLADGNVMVIAQNDSNEVEIYLPPFTVRPFGTQQKYVALTSEPAYTYDKRIETAVLLSAIFGE